MKNSINIIGPIGSVVTLQSIVDQVSLCDLNQPIDVYIHTNGGVVTEGLAIYNYLKSLPQQINTHSAGTIASIGTIIALAGNKDTRTKISHDKYLIHLPSGGAKGNAEDIEKTARTLRAMESDLADVYSKETNLTKDQALEIMAKDEFLTNEFLLENGFVAEVGEFKAVAIFEDLQKIKLTKINKMTEINIEEVEGKFSKFLNSIFGDKKKTEEPTNKMETGATGEKIDFPDVDSDGVPKEGDSAVIDGKPAEGSVLMPNGDTYNFEAGKLIKIDMKPAEENQELIDAKQRVADLEAKQTELEASIQEKDGIIAEKETLIENSKVEVEEMKNSIESFKNEIVSDYVPAKKEKKEDKGAPKSRSL